MILTIIQSRITTVILGIVLIGYALFDIYEELFDPTHEHILIIIGVLLVISSFGHMNEGAYKIAQNVRPDRELRFFEKVASFFNLSIVRVILGLTILVAAAYGLYEDFEKIHSKSVSMGIGVFMIILPVIKAIIGGGNLMKGVRNVDKEDAKSSL